MKKLFLTSILLAMCFLLFAQRVVYTNSNDKKEFVKEDLDIVFSNSDFVFPQKQSFIASFLPTAVDAAFKATTKILENRVKKFTAEYSKQKSNLTAAEAKVPNFKFIRKIQLQEGGNLEDALAIEFEAHKVAELGFIYQVKSIRLNYSAAKTSRSSRQFDYTIELKLNYVVDGEKKSVDLSPIAISSVSFGANSFENLKHRTDIIPFVQNSFVTEVSIKIVETNPAKVRAEKILSIWNDHKDDTKTIINNFLPKEKEESSDGDGGKSSEGNG
jgi:hypothetical protein